MRFSGAGEIRTLKSLNYQNLLLSNSINLDCQTRRSLTVALGLSAGCAGR